MHPIDFWAMLRATSYSFWICRVSVLSLLLGWMLFYAAPQAQALFLDLYAPGIAFWHWLAFYVSILLFWMLPVQLTARVMLHVGQDRVQQRDLGWYAFLVVHLPWLLALFCLLSVAVGQNLGMDHIPDANNRHELEEVAYTQLRDLQLATLILIALWALAWLVLSRFIYRVAVGSGLLDIALFRFIATVLFGRRGTNRTYGANATPTGDGQTGRFSPEQLQTGGAAVGLFIIWLLSIFLVFRSPLEIRPELS